MALSKIELTQLVEHYSKHDPFANWKRRDDQLHFRSLYVKHDYQLDRLGPMYSRKLKRIIEHYDFMRQGLDNIPTAELADALMNVENKIRRIAEKVRDTDMEIRGRQLDTVKRNPIGTEYFIDLTAGNNANTGLSPAQAWRTMEQYTTTSVRSPGDIAWVRAGTTELVGANDINCDEDGTAAQPIYIIGCSSGSGSGSDAVDPWGDDDDTKPIVDFNNGAYTWYFNDDLAWEIERIAVRNSNDNGFDSSNVSILTTTSIKFRSCAFYDRANTAGVTLSGCRVRGARGTFIDCDFYGNRSHGLHLDSQGEAMCYRCRFDGGATTQDYGVGGMGHGYFEECGFGQTTAHDLSDLATGGGEMIFKACDFNDFDIPIGFATMTAVYWEDCSGTPTASGSQWTTEFRTGKYEDEVPVGDSGLSRYSVRMAWLRGNYDDTGEGVGMALSRLSYFGPMRLWLAAGSYTIKVKIRADAAWASYPTAGQLYLAARFYDESSSYSVGESFSDEVLDDGTDWVDFEVAITTGREGPVYLDVILDKYEAGPKGIYVYPFPEVTAV